MLLALLALAGCKKFDMAAQPKNRTWDASSFLPQGRVMQPPPSGSVAHGLPGDDVAAPSVITAALLRRGRERYGIYCTPCHAASGDGSGMIVERGFPRPPPLYAERLRQAPASHFYDVMTHGYGVMYSYAARVAPSDRWAIAAYIRALQASEATDRRRLAASDLAALDGTGDGPDDQAQASP